MQLRLPGEGRCRFALGEADEEADVGEAVPRGGALPAAMSHCPAKVVRHDASVVDGRTERGQIPRCRLGHRRRGVDDSFNGYLSATQCNQVSKYNLPFIKCMPIARIA